MIAAVLVVVAVVVAMVLERRRAEVPFTVRRGAVPSRVRPEDVGLEAGPSIVVFTEASCNSCQSAIRLVRGPAGADLPVADVEFGEAKGLHEQFGIDTVPTTVVVHHDGVVAAGWTGKIDPGDLALALAEVLGQGPDAD
ncbi:MAG: hypothetical protein P8N02_00240 [Actinomycetota bacterium]|nr:hypothetical protein [Actinomycetota bacterium]